MRTNRKWYCGVLACAFAFLSAPQTHAKSVTVPIAVGHVQIFAAQTQPFYVLEVSVPEEVSGRRLDAALLAFYVDASVVEGTELAHNPIIEVRALTGAYGGNGSPQFSSVGGARNVVLGSGRRVQVDITAVVKGWIAAPETNHGLLVSAGAGAGDFTVRGDVLGGSVVAKVTYIYQNRWGGRVSSE